MKRVLIALACLYLGGCTLSGVPITDADGSQTDPALVGAWRYVAGKETKYARITEMADGQMGVEMPDEDGKLPGKIPVLLARIGGHNYASFACSEPGRRPCYILGRYEFESPDRFVTYGATAELGDDIERKLIAGKFDEQPLARVFELYASEADLRRFVTEHGARIFKQRGYVFERVPRMP